MKNYENWDDLPEQVLNDLEEWYNHTVLGEEDYDLLFELFNKGQFHAWDCTSCGERCFNAEPDNWENFQGVNQIDYVSYPYYAPGWCDDCRERIGFPIEKEIPPSDFENFTSY